MPKPGDEAVGVPGAAAGFELNAFGTEAPDDGVLVEAAVAGAPEFQEWEKALGRRTGESV